MSSSEFVRHENASCAHEHQERDRELMRRVRDDDSTALDELLGVYWEPIVGYARRMLGSVDRAEDVAQQAFIELWESRQSWQGGTARSYIYRTARNLALNELRHRAVHARWLDRIRRQYEARSPVKPDDELAGRELEQAVEAALAQLPERRREAFTLVRHHGMSYRQAAEIMGTSAQTVANQVTAALTELRSLLDTRTRTPAQPSLRLLQPAHDGLGHDALSRPHGSAG